MLIGLIPLYLPHQRDVAERRAQELGDRFLVDLLSFKVDQHVPQMKDISCL